MEEKYGMLRVVSEDGINRHGKKLWRCLCDCGNVTTTVASDVRTGHTRSCGCQKHVGNGRTHGKRRTRLYAIWCNMKARCDNSANPSYHNYGGRGIAYCPQWSTFENFARDVGDPPENTLTLDRVNNNGDYEPGNVRWVSRRVQSRNTRQNVWVEIDGQTRCLYDWCRIYEIAAASVYRRLAKDEDIVSAITRPKASRFNKGGVR